MSKVNLTGLSSTEYEHPFDKRALDRLQQTRGLDLITRKVLDMGLERYMRIKHTGDNVQVTPKNIPDLFEMLTSSCEVLDMEEVPEFYIFLEDKIRSYSSGDKQQLIALSSGCLELLEPQEILFMIGRELGHIKSNHVLYRMIADSLTTLSRLAGDMSLGISNWLTIPLEAAFMHWYRMSEFTADRAGLLACQDFETAISAFIKIAGLPRKYHGQVTVDDFLLQSEQFDNFKSSGFDNLIRFAAINDNHQPFTVIRTAQMAKWVEQGAYDRILRRERSLPRLRCQNIHCRKPLEVDDKFCAFCGMKVKMGTATDDKRIEQ